MNEVREHVAQVGHDPQPLPAGLDDEGRAVHAVMGSGDRVHEDLAELQLVVRTEVAHVLHLPERTPRRRGGERRRRHVDRETVFPLEHAGVADVVGMVVRDDHGVDGADVPAVGGKALRGLTFR